MSWMSNRMPSPRVSRQRTITRFMNNPTSTSLHVKQVKLAVWDITGNVQNEGGVNFGNATRLRQTLNPWLFPLTYSWEETRPILTHLMWNFQGTGTTNSSWWKLTSTATSSRNSRFMKVDKVLKNSTLAGGTRVYPVTETLRETTSCHL